MKIKSSSGVKHLELASKAIAVFSAFALVASLVPAKSLSAFAINGEVESAKSTSSLTASYETGSTSITKPTKEQIRNKYKGITACASTRFAQAPSITSPYSLGKLPDQSLKSGQDWINFMRFAANLPEISLTDELNESAQYCAVTMAANNSMSHQPSQPADMDDDFYNYAYYSSITSNIAYTAGSPLSYFNSRALNALPSAVQGWMDDADSGNIPMVGHRRWMLYPYTTTMGLGSADNTSSSGMSYAYSAVRVFNNVWDSHYSASYASVDTSASVSYDSIAWPASGYFPSNVFDNDTPWSITLNPSTYEAPDNTKVSVKLTRKSDGTSWTLQNGSTNGYFKVNNDNYGVNNAIIFRPSGLGEDALSGEWDVEISNIYKLGETTPTTLSYTVNFFDVNEKDEAEKTDISSADVFLKDNVNTFVYTGSEIKPEVTVMMGTTTLKEGTDYTLAYSDNTNPGTATVTITGTGDYKGTASKTFTINNADPTDLNSAITTATDMLTTDPNSDQEIHISTDGTDIETGLPWVTQAVHDALNTAIEKAQAVATKTPLSQSDVDTAMTELSSACETYQASIKHEPEEEVEESHLYTVSVSGSGTAYFNNVWVLDGSRFPLGYDEDLVIKWTPEIKNSTNFVFVSSLKINGVEQSGAASVNKSSWKTTNTEYKRRMKENVKMVEFNTVKSKTQTFTIKADDLKKLAPSDDMAIESIELTFKEVVPVYRLYNMITSEHLFTTSKGEYDNWVSIGKKNKDVWIGEGIDWFAPKTYSSSTSAKVYRLYNAALGAMGRSSHYYTSDTSEINNLVKNHGWKKETQFDGGYVFLSDKTSSATPIWTCYNEALGSAHHYTSDKTEWTGLSKHGWDLEKTKNGTKGVFAAVMSAK